jgi:two-component system response regulator AtoC
LTKASLVRVEAIKKVTSIARKAANSEINVSLTGETGSGKEVFAKAIHLNGTRKKKPFITVNMAAIPPNLMESELFGFEKGSFTGAISHKKVNSRRQMVAPCFWMKSAKWISRFKARFCAHYRKEKSQELEITDRFLINIRLITANTQKLI